MAHDAEPLAETSVVKFKNQDFRSLRDHCLRRWQLFIDDTFPAEASSIGQKLLKGKRLSKLEWKRPQVSKPHLGAQQALRIWELCTMASPCEKRMVDSQTTKQERKIRFLWFLCCSLTSSPRNGRALCSERQSLNHGF